MITLDIEAYCHDCIDFSPIVNRTYADNAVYEQRVTCEHIYRCRAICRHVRECCKKEEHI